MTRTLEVHKLDEKWIFDEQLVNELTYHDPDFLKVALCRHAFSCVRAQTQLEQQLDSGTILGEHNGS